MTVAALYVETGGVYFGLPDVDPWDEARDARLYEGPWPVVAHPPCNRWARLGRIDGRGQDEGRFASALAAVRKWGGVLEHPAESRAWRAFGLQRPLGPAWTRSTVDPAAGWVCAVDQNLYGFPTRKPTWLYFVGDEPPMMPGRRATARRGCDALWSTERCRTPEAFRDALLAMARSAALTPA
jgi:hypothetical protein